MNTHDDTVAHVDSVPAPVIPRSRLRSLFVGVAILAILLDSLTKTIVVSQLSPGQPVKLLGGMVYLTLTRNSGAAFSLASDYTGALSLLAVVVVGAICWFAWRRLGSVWWAVALGLIAGGALGNLVDRVFRAPGVFQGHVVDFISVFDPYGGAWPIFNLADSSLVVGVALVIGLELTGRRMEGAADKPRAEDDAGES